MRLLRLVIRISLIALFYVPVAHAADPPLNVLLVTVESLRAGHVGCYGYDRDTTPTLDRLAAEGVRFETAYSHAPWTSPSVISLLTGLTPPAHGVERRGASLPESVVTLPEALAAAGWNVPGLSYVLAYDNYRNLGFSPPPSSDWNGRPVADLVEAVENDSPEPFFTWLHYKWTHLPYDPEPADLAAFRDAPLPDGEGIDAVRSQETVLAGSVAFADAEKRAAVDLYDGDVRGFDRALAKLLDALSRRGVLERTIVIVTADHGDELFDHGWVGHASTSRRAKLFEEMLRVPLVLWRPGVLPAGRVVRGSARQIDVAPTLLDLLGVPPVPEMEGRSLLPVVRSGATIPSVPVMAETTLGGYQSSAEDARVMVRSLRDGRWKLIHVRRTDGDEFYLFDLARDPGEKRDLAATKMRRRKAMLRLLTDRLYDSMGLRIRFLDAPITAGKARDGR